jgi:hypothetical protein
MKTLLKIFSLLLITSLMVSCDKDFERPPLNEPTYTGPDANITIAKLKEMYANTVDPVLIETAFVLKATVVGNDVSGNIYKQIYVEDNTGGINLGIDYNNIATEYAVGQEVFIDLHGLYVVKYGGELQLGLGTTQANRIPWLIAEKQIHRDKFANPANAIPKVVTLDALNDNMVNTLVQLDKVYFVNGGKNAFTTNNATTDEPLKDGNGKTISVRTSQYSKFAKTMLPEGGGTVVGILGRFNGGWQFIVRSIDDIQNFGQPLPEPPADNALFKETFGSADVTTKPKIAAYTGYDSKAPITFTDPLGTADIRATKTFDNHVWFKAGEVDLKIAGINTTGQSGLVLSYDITGNIYNEGDEVNINVLKVKFNGTELTVPSIVLNKADGYGNKYYNVVLDISSIAASNNATIEFSATAQGNALGLRLDNIKIYKGTAPVIPNPSK